MLIFSCRSSRLGVDRWVETKKHHGAGFRQSIAGTGPGEPPGIPPPRSRGLCRERLSSQPSPGSAAKSSCVGANGRGRATPRDRGRGFPHAGSSGVRGSGPAPAAVRGKPLAPRPRGVCATHEWPVPAPRLLVASHHFGFFWGVGNPSTPVPAVRPPSCPAPRQVTLAGRRPACPGGRSPGLTATAPLPEQEARRGEPGKTRAPAAAAKPPAVPPAPSPARGAAAGAPAAAAGSTSPSPPSLSALSLIPRLKGPPLASPPAEGSAGQRGGGVWPRSARRGLRSRSRSLSRSPSRSPPPLGSGSLGM
ncbi:uncharacterized protein LOC142360588 [Opisthocomus hoazin]|uniref:uncharacterized protein LOC142360588 n=1 Tax=Opisthocomus hoazin TaxID=30419 RepID=UPI003F5382B4